MRLTTESVTLNESRNVSLDAYIIAQSADEAIGNISVPDRRPAVIICPGGGYAILADRERLPAALPFMAEGYQTFVLSYSLGDDSQYPNPLVDLSMAVRWVRMNADRFSIDPERIAVLGFSAGGHCAAMLATQWNRENWKASEQADIAILGLEELLSHSNRPNAAVLCYATTDLRAFPDVEETRGQDSGLGRIIVDLAPESNPVDYIDEDTCPVFLWHTAEDETVPAYQSIDFARRLLNANVPVELHLYERGVHGLSTANKLTDYGRGDTLPPAVPGWTNLALTWLNDLFAY